MKKNFDIPEMLSVKDVKEYLNLSQTTVYRLFRDSNFPSVKIGGIRRISKEDFLSWLENQKK